MKAICWLALAAFMGGVCGFNIAGGNPLWLVGLTSAAAGAMFIAFVLETGRILNRRALRRTFTKPLKGDYDA